MGVEGQVSRTWIRSVEDVPWRGGCGGNGRQMSTSNIALHNPGGGAEAAPFHRVHAAALAFGIARTSCADTTDHLPREPGGRQP